MPLLSTSAETRIYGHPVEWATLIRNAHHNLKPFHVQVLKNSEFQNWKSVQESMKMNRPKTDANGNQVKWSKIRMLKVLATNLPGYTIDLQCVFETF